jgi:competence protein ComEC
MGLVWTGAASALAWIISWGIRYVLLVAELLAAVPMSAVYTKSFYIVLWLVFCYMLLGLFLLMKKKHPVVLVGCVVLSLCVSVLVSWSEPLRDNYRVTVLDVGQGQCILLQSDGHNYLVDCGGKGEEGTADEAAETLLSQGISKLDGIIVTHFDSDHSAGIENLLSRVDADVILFPAMDHHASAAEGVAEATNGSVYAVDETMELFFSDTSIRIMPSYSGGSDNKSSLCVLFQTENCAILITGDRDGFGERMLLRNEEIPDIDVLIVGHHGSKYSTCEELLLATKPETAIISVGENNPYGHPAQETLDRLKKYGCVIYRTDLHGTIIYRG